MRINYFMTLCLTISLGLSSTPSRAEQEGRGSDRVEALFNLAKTEITAKVNGIKFEQIDDLDLKPAFKAWLKNQNQPRLAKLQYYISKMKLRFQDAPCLEPEGPRGACYEYDKDSPPTADHDYFLFV